MHKRAANPKSIHKQKNPKHRSVTLCGARGRNTSDVDADVTCPDCKEVERSIAQGTSPSTFAGEPLVPPTIEEAFEKMAGPVDPLPPAKFDINDRVVIKGLTAKHPVYVVRRWIEEPGAAFRAGWWYELSGDSAIKSHEDGIEAWNTEKQIGNDPAGDGGIAQRELAQGAFDIDFVSATPPALRRTNEPLIKIDYKELETKELAGAASAEEIAKHLNENDPNAHYEVKDAHTLEVLPATTGTESKVVDLKKTPGVLFGRKPPTVVPPVEDLEEMPKIAPFPKADGKPPSGLKFQVHAIRIELEALVQRLQQVEKQLGMPEIEPVVPPMSAKEATVGSSMLTPKIIECFAPKRDHEKGERFLIKAFSFVYKIGGTNPSPPCVYESDFMDAGFAALEAGRLRKLQRDNPGEFEKVWAEVLRRAKEKKEGKTPKLNTDLGTSHFIAEEAKTFKK